MKTEIKLIATLFNAENKVLLEKFDDGYKLPSGAMQESERIEDAYKRFLLEETGLTIELLGIVDAFNFDDVDQISIVYSCTHLFRYEPKKQLPDKYQWYAREETKELVLPLPYREMVIRAYFVPNYGYTS